MAHDKNAPGTPLVAISKSHVMQEYMKDIAVKFLDFVAEGRTVKDITENEPNMPTRQTLYRWLTLYKEFNAAYWAAKELSAAALEDRALDIAGKLEKESELTGTRISALKEAMVQFRWSAARRDPKRYGGNAPVTAVTVPIQVNTTLDLNTGAGEMDGYSFTARIAQPIEEGTSDEPQAPGPRGNPCYDPNEDVDTGDVDPYNAPEVVPVWNGRRGPDATGKKPKPRGRPYKALGPRQRAAEGEKHVAMGGKQV
jgi:hypothetical protein